MAGPPKMRLPYAPNQLRLVQDSNDSSPAADHQSPSIYPGIRYVVSQNPDQAAISPNVSDQSGWIGDFCFDQQSSTIKPLQSGQSAFLWDSSQLQRTRSGQILPVRDNSCLLLASGLSELTIEQCIGGHMLTMAPTFSIQFNTQAFTACLAELRLVTGKRFVTLDDSSQQLLMDTEPAAGPVLYIDDSQSNQPLQQCTDWQLVATERQYEFRGRVHLPLRPAWQGQAVKSITVLEHYRSYLMQRALNAQASDSIWVPVQPPITWGWSIRVEPEHTDWIITRRKLISPIVGHDGMELPQWHGNSLEYRHENA